MDHFLISSYEATHQSISWLAVALIALALAVTDLWFGIISTMAFGVIIAVTASLMLLFALSLERDSKLSSKKV
jgi:Na+(H+)/acetate symporter ActP